MSTKLTKDSLLQRRGHKKIVLFFSPRNFCWCGFNGLFTLFYSSFSGWSCCIIYCLSHLENRSWFVWGYYSNNANKCTWNQYYRFTQPLFHSSWGDWWSKNLKRMNTFLIGSLFFLGGEQQIFPNFPANNFWKIQGRKINFILFFL